jgi:hypothetical protein
MAAHALPLEIHRNKEFKHKPVIAPAFTLFIWLQYLNVKCSKEL